MTATDRIAQVDPAARWLVVAGLDVPNLAGGMKAWAADATRSAEPAGNRGGHLMCTSESGSGLLSGPTTGGSSGGS